MKSNKVNEKIIEVTRGKDGISSILRPNCHAAKVFYRLCACVRFFPCSID